MSSLSGLFIYPVKSLAGISLSEAQVQDRGLQFDRRWLIVDDNNDFITQRELPVMATIDTEIIAEGLRLTPRGTDSSIQVPFDAEGASLEVRVWRNTATAIECGPTAAHWLSEALGVNCRLVRMPDTTRRLVDTAYARNGEVTSFADGFPFLVLGQASLDDLNDRLDETVPADRFRTNFLFEGGDPFEEDGWSRFRIGAVEFEVLKPCARCVMTTNDQRTGQRAGREPLKTLATYRNREGKVYFAQNAVALNLGTVRLGDEIEVLSRRPSVFSLA